MSLTRKEAIGTALIIAIMLSAMLILILKGPIPQDVNYHTFTDDRNLLSVLNFWNVVSNVPFFLVGTIGLYKTIMADRLIIQREIKTSYALLFFGVTLVAFGSGYYHLWPDNQTLVWDRLPMTIAFMALFSIIISEFISISFGRALLLPLIIAGVASVLYWHFGEMRGEGDLRVYAFVQFFPLLVIPIILVCFRSRCTGVNAYWWLLVAYIVAKIFEHFDTAVYSVLGLISGHSIKHMIAALGLYVLLASYEKRSCN